MRLSSRSLTILLFLLAFSGAALADKCESFSIYTCAKGAHDGAYIGGAGTLIASPGAGLLLTSNTFTVSTHDGAGGEDVIILAASHGSLTGTLNGTAFTSLSSFPEGGATGAIVTNLQATGFCGSNCNLSFGYVDLHSALPANGSLTVTAAGVAPGTVFYADVLACKCTIMYITANSESAILGGGVSAVPEPGSLSLLVTGLCGIAGGAWRKLRG